LCQWLRVDGVGQEQRTAHFGGVSEGGGSLRDG